MAFNERLAMLITANGSQAVGEFKKVGTAAGRNLTVAETKAQKLGATLTKVGVGLLTFGGITAVALFKAAGAASNLEQATGAIEAVLPGAAAGVQAWSETTADAFGLSERAAKESVAQIGAQLKGLGLAESEAAAQAQVLVERGADLAATFGGPVDDAVSAIAATLRGERDPIERYGVAMKQVDINARVMADGLDTSTVASKKASEAQAALSILLEQTADSEGQFGRESETLAGQMAILKANGEEMAAAIGEQAAPAFADLFGAATTVLDVFGELPGPIQSAASRFLVWTSALSLGVGAISLVGGQLVKLTDKLPALGAALGRTRVKFQQMSSTMKTGIQGGALAAGAAIAILAQRWAEQEAQAKKTREAVKGLADAYGEAGEAGIAAAITEGLQDLPGVIPILNDAGVSVQELVEGAQQGGVAYERLRTKILDTADATGSSATEMDVLAGALDQTFGENVPAAIAASGELTAAEESNAGAADATAEAVMSEAEAFSVLVDEIDAYLEQTFSIEDAQAALAEAQQGLLESLVTNGAAWDLNTEAGRANRDAGQELVETTAGVVSALAEQSGKTLTAEQAQRQMNSTVGSAVGKLDAARAAGVITGEQYVTLKGQINDIPATVSTNVSSNVGTVLSQFNELRRVTSGGFAGVFAGISAAAAASRPAHGGFIRAGETRLTHSDELISNEVGQPTGVTSQAATSSIRSQHGTTGASGRPVENVVMLDGDVLARKLAPRLRAVDRENF